MAAAHDQSDRSNLFDFFLIAHVCTVSTDFKVVQDGDHGQTRPDAESHSIGRESAMCALVIRVDLHHGKKKRRDSGRVTFPAGPDGKVFPGGSKAAGFAFLVFPAVVS